MRTIRTKTKLLTLAVLLAALQACSAGLFDPDPRAELRAARALWQSQGITSYRYTLFKSCGECLPEWAAPARVEVREGRTVSVEALNGARPIQRQAFEEYDTVDDLFALIEAVLDQDPYRFHARYDLRRGHPVEHSVDYHREYVDDEGGFTIADFEIIRQEP